MNILIKGILWVVCFTVFSVQAAVTMRLTPDIIYTGESTQLTFVSDKPFDEQIDLTSLQSDFIIRGPAMQTFQSIVNGVQSVRYEMVYYLFPQKNGRFNIDKIRYRGQNLPPLTLQVTPLSSSTETPVLELKASVSDNAVYAGQSFVYAVTAIVPDNAVQMEIIPPKISNGEVTQLNSDSQKLILKDSRRMLELTRRFLVTPETTDSLDIIPAELNGSLETVNQKPKRSLADMFDAGILFEGFSPVSRRPFFLRATDVSVKILEKPSDWKGWWLPAQQVTLNEEKPLPAEIRAGEPFERVVVLTAKGTAATHLPIPAQPSTDRLNVYTGSQSRDTRITSTGIPEGVLKTTIALSATQAGTVQIPAISVPWFDTLSKTVKYAVLPAQTIRVLPSAVVKSDQTMQTAENKNKGYSDDPNTFVSKTDTVSSSVERKAGIIYFILTFFVGLTAGILLGGMIVLSYFKNTKKKGFYQKKSGLKKKKPLPDLYPF